MPRRCFCARWQLPAVRRTACRFQAPSVIAACRITFYAVSDFRANIIITAGEHFLRALIPKHINRRVVINATKRADATYALAVAALATAKVLRCRIIGRLVREIFMYSSRGALRDAEV